MMKLVLAPRVEDARLEKIVKAAGDMRVMNAADGVEAVREIRDADAFFGKIEPAMLAAATRLRWVQTPTASLEHYLFPELIEHPSTLTNMRGLFSDVLTEHAFAYILSFTRNLHIYIRRQIEARWEAIGGENVHPFSTGQAIITEGDLTHGHLPGKTLGIVGFGAVGAELARRGLAFGMQVIAVDPHRRPLPDPSVVLWHIDRLPELLNSSDFVVVTAPHTPATVGMFAREQFRRMKRTAYFINIGRGATVKLRDLTEALQASEIAGAGLDVFETEPLPADNPLWGMENVILTPHIGSHSTLIAARHLEVLLDNIRRFVAGEPLRNVVDKRLWY